MKKAFLCFLLVFVLVFAGAAVAAMSLHQSRDQVTVTTITQVGDPAAVQGLTARQTVGCGGYLQWDLSIPLDRPETSSTRFSYASRYHVIDDYEPDGIWIVPADNAAFFYTGVTLDSLADDSSPVQTLLAPLFRSVAEKTQPGCRYTEDVRLKDYTDIYPLQVSFDGYYGSDLPWQARYQKAPSWYSIDDSLRQALQTFFSFPVPQEEIWAITVEKDENGAITELNYESKTSPSIILNTSAVWSDTDLYFAFDQHSYGLPSFHQVPGGYGVYHLSITPEEDTVYLELDSLETLVSLPEGSMVLDLALSGDESSLLLTYGLGPDTFFLVLDPETGEARQSFSVPARPAGTVETATLDSEGNPQGTYTSPYWSTESILSGENFTVLYGDDTLYLYTLENGTYTYAFSAPMQTHLRSGYSYDHLYGAWNGTQLALGSVSGLQALALSVYEGGQLQYHGVYKTSLGDVASTASQPEEDEFSMESDSLALFPEQALTLVWEG